MGLILRRGGAARNGLCRAGIFHGVVRRLPDSIAWKTGEKFFHGVENPDF